MKAGREKQKDFPRVTCLGKQAENCERFLAKGRLGGVPGRIQKGSYSNKDGATVYTTDVVADRVEFLEWGEKTGTKASASVPEGFEELDEDVPF